MILAHLHHVLHHVAAVSSAGQTVLLAFVILGSVLWFMVLFGWIYEHWPRYGPHVYRGTALNPRNHEMINRIDQNE
jgi:hypothetical protein